MRWRIEQDYRELKDGPGLDHFEGRSRVGWHRHVTLASVAQAVCTKLRRTPKAPAQTSFRFGAVAPVPVLRRLTAR